MWMGNRHAPYTFPPEGDRPNVTVWWQGYAALTAALKWLAAKLKQAWTVWLTSHSAGGQALLFNAERLLRLVPRGTRVAAFLNSPMWYLHSITEGNMTGLYNPLIDGNMTWLYNLWDVAKTPRTACLQTEAATPWKCMFPDVALQHWPPHVPLFLAQDFMDPLKFRGVVGTPAQRAAIQAELLAITTPLNASLFLCTCDPLCNHALLMQNGQGPVVNGMNGIHATKAWLRQGGIRRVRYVDTCLSSSPASSV
uniref:Uncharacterized protein n=1 Tax=Eutreptiella gymnastica TaxID=73025 RepID=A0A7S1HSK7_9EUGL|mmetsp:Transcript_102411/g.176824  ORF Transcript_102411/g.176824 Transcript_102411/m.176824 type:complete len:252 (+) Transcript_102411:2-757(+)